MDSRSVPLATGHRPFPLEIGFVMTREQQDGQLIIHSAIEPSVQTRVIRSHRRMPSYNFSFLRSTLALIAIAFIATTVTTSVSMPDSKPTSARTAALQIAPAAPSWLPPVTALAPPVAAPEISSQPPKTAPPRDGESQRASRSEPRTTTPAQSKIEKVIAFALAQVGDPYRWAKSGPNSYDCSGLVLAAYKTIGISLPHYTGTMVTRGIRVSKSQMVRGDIVFPSSGHVGIYLGSNQMVHASSSKGKVVVGKLSTFYTARRMVQ